MMFALENWNALENDWKSAWNWNSWENHWISLEIRNLHWKMDFSGKLGLWENRFWDLNCFSEEIDLRILGKSGNSLEKYSWKGKWILRKFWKIWENWLLKLENGFSRKWRSLRKSIFENFENWNIENVKTLENHWFELGKYFEMSFKNSEFWENQILIKT